MSSSAPVGSAASAPSASSAPDTPAEVPPPAYTARQDADAHDVYLEVEINGERTSLIVHFVETKGKLSATGEDLASIGVAIERAHIAPQARVSLDAIPGLEYTYDTGRQLVDLRIADAIRKPFTFDSRTPERTPPATASRGLLINYDAFAQTNTDARLAIWSEERYFDTYGVLSNTGIGYLYRQDQRYVRYDTSWMHSNPDALTTTQVGDTISSSLAWTRSIRLAGLQWRSNFSLRPDLVTFPIPSLSGSAVVPSSVDLYINQVRQFSGNVPSGPFVVNDVPGITGGGNATVITRDALGRSIVTSVPLYIDTRMLTAGLASYSVEAGFLRRQYGLESFDYDPHPAFSGSARYGVTDTLTFESHGEATSGLYNAGAGVLLRLGTVGVVNTAFAASTGHFAGTQVSAGYQMIQPHFSLDLQTIRAFGRYGDLASADGTPVPTTSDRVTLSVPLFNTQTVGLSYLGYKYPGAPDSHIASVSYSLNLGTLVSVNLSGFKDFGQNNTSGAFVSLNIGLGDNISVSTNAGEQDGKASYSAQATRPPNYEGGWGWGVQGGSNGIARYGQAQVQYLGRYGEATAVVQDVGGTTNTSLDLTGALVLMDGSVQAARRIYDGFALVSTDGAAGIPVLHENRVIGTTDHGGHLLVPDLNSYQTNRLAIDSMNLPADAHVGTTSLDIVPQSESGVLAHFSVEHYSAATLILVDAARKPIPAGSRVRDPDTGKQTIVGYDGMTFVDGLQGDNHLRIEQPDGARCTVHFPYVRPSDGSLPTFGPLECEPLKESTP
ncbi:Fimbrial protein [Pararobbsia alpina]|uniref:fimbria/pilus outer membrane usher protein n=1 Tax=Pararobbsia alpina TaxID=621374 RepID=UPI0039A494CA